MQLNLGKGECWFATSSGLEVSVSCMQWYHSLGMLLVMHVWDVNARGGTGEDRGTTGTPSASNRGTGKVPSTEMLWGVECLVWSSGGVRCLVQSPGAVRLGQGLVTALLAASQLLLSSSWKPRTE